ncbi:hypothetical protein K439DRAFT_1635350 [Ramaria rubella]|nr:hypothetical protein K439DRAFT_1635350 [Ramaria rubella]
MQHPATIDPSFLLHSSHQPNWSQFRATPHSQPPPVFVELPEHSDIDDTHHNSFSALDIQNPSLFSYRATVEDLIAAFHRTAIGPLAGVTVREECAVPRATPPVIVLADTPRSCADSIDCVLERWHVEQEEKELEMRWRATRRVAENWLTRVERERDHLKSRKMAREKEGKKGGKLLVKDSNAWCPQHSPLKPCYPQPSSTSSPPVPVPLVPTPTKAPYAQASHAQVSFPNHAPSSGPTESAPSAPLISSPTPAHHSSASIPHTPYDPRAPYLALEELIHTPALENVPLPTLGGVESNKLPQQLPDRESGFEASPADVQVPTTCSNTGSSCVTAQNRVISRPHTPFLTTSTIPPQPITSQERAAIRARWRWERDKARAKNNALIPLLHCQLCAEYHRPAVCPKTQMCVHEFKVVTKLLPKMSTKPVCSNLPTRTRFLFPQDSIPTIPEPRSMSVLTSQEKMNRHVALLPQAPRITAGQVVVRGGGARAELAPMFLSLFPEYRGADEEKDEDGTLRLKFGDVARDEGQVDVAVGVVRGRTSLDADTRAAKRARTGPAPIELSYTDIPFGTSLDQKSNPNTPQSPPSLPTPHTLTTTPTTAVSTASPSSAAPSSPSLKTAATSLHTGISPESIFASSFSIPSGSVPVGRRTIRIYTKEDPIPKARFEDTGEDPEVSIGVALKVPGEIHRTTYWFEPDVRAAETIWNVVKGMARGRHGWRKPERKVVSGAGGLRAKGPDDLVL